MKYIEIKAPAKINIGLNILSKREDGFHNLSTLFYPIIDLYDLLTFELSDKFDFKCNTNTVPNDETNLVVKAKNLLENVSGKKINVKINLEKNIPSQAGLGGGSSDAAATLISLNEIFQLGLDNKKLNELALQLGSDVPFFIKSKSAIGTSRGEILELVDLEIIETILIINPGISISTKDAFHNITPNNSGTDFHSLIEKGKLNYDLVRQKVKNDFEKFVFGKYPEIENIKLKLYQMGALFASLSGSGSSVYGIFPNIESAQSAKQHYHKNYFCFLSNPHC
ncbi:MAG: 4-(cytidine 5'-diphospho)-2-C-methyl-D-erythritol kinase [Melioribacter sp.]|nr:4-(cytidine 5'-diphospho)-2-C-methyl-D-erythritol kinase [Melioribacter sp.]